MLYCPFTTDRSYQSHHTPKPAAWLPLTLRGSSPLAPLCADHPRTLSASLSRAPDGSIPARWPGGQSAHETVRPASSVRKCLCAPCSRCPCTPHSLPPATTAPATQRVAPTSAPGRSVQDPSVAPCTARKCCAPTAAPIPRSSWPATDRARLPCRLSAESPQPHHWCATSKKPNVRSRPPAPSTRRFRCRGFRPPG